jgi:dolichol-phosphate mannosyltransferase
MDRDSPGSAGREPRVLVITPTYDEVLNLERVLTAIHAAYPAADVLVVDDGSPDGTADLADRLGEKDARIHVMRRPGKLGLGSAYLAGFAWGLERGYDVLVEMDADGSHPADRLPALVAAVTDGAGLAIGSRWTKGGSVVDWPKSRELLSRGANLYARLALGFGVHDSTAGYRAFRDDVLRAIQLEGVDSRGYCFQIDLTLRTSEAGFPIVEVPIRFVDRIAGVSKMSGTIVGEAMWRVTIWGLARRFGRGRRLSAS